MKYEKYISLIKSLEASAAKNPGFYHFKVLLLTVLGYAYFVGLILLALIPIGAIVLLIWAAPGQIAKLLLYAVKLWWVLIPVLALLGFIGSAIKAITAKVPDPEGSDLARAEAPELFEFVEKTCLDLQAKKPAKILVVDEFNAAVVTMPRYGIFGQKVLLLVGLPLMKALSSEQFKAVLAHEVGHISGKHGAFAKWAYQMREAWGRLIDSQEANNHKFASLYKNFVDWFFPYYTAYSFVLMREHEKDADSDAAMLVGNRPLGEALILMETKGTALNDDFWREVHKENLASETPSEKIFTRMLSSLAFVSEERSISSLSKAIAVPTDFNDSHPALADRLRLIGYWTTGDLPDLPKNVEVDAASVFLGAAAERFAAQFDAAWDEHTLTTWKERHEHFQEGERRISELEEKRVGGELSLEELREIGRLLTERDGIAAAVSVIEEAAERFPDEAVVWYNLGGMRLFQDDEQGLAYLEKAMEMDQAFKFDANQLAFDYLRSKGRLDEARRFASIIDEHNELLEKAQKERINALPGDKFEIHDLPKEFIDKVAGKIAGIDEINAIYAVHKVVEYMPEFPFRVLFVDLRKKGRIKNRHDADPSTIFNMLVERFDTGEFHYFALLNGEWAGTKYYLDRIPGALIYQRP